MWTVPSQGLYEDGLPFPNGNTSNSATQGVPRTPTSRDNRAIDPRLLDTPDLASTPTQPSPQAPLTPSDAPGPPLQALAEVEWVSSPLSNASDDDNTVATQSLKRKRPASNAGDRRPGWPGGGPLGPRGVLHRRVETGMLLKKKTLAC